MNLRTFLPPPVVTVASAPPAVGEPARELPEPVAWPALVAFLRHTGCPFAEATMRTLRDLSEDLPVVAVSHAPKDATAGWCEAIGGAGNVRVLVDEERVYYAKWGLGRSSLSHFMGRRSLGEVAKLARSGVRNRHPDGTRWQQAGTFRVDMDGLVAWRHLPRHAGDLPAAAGELDSLADHEVA